MATSLLGRRLVNKKFSNFVNNLTSMENDVVAKVEVDPSKFLEGIPQESAKK